MWCGFNAAYGAALTASQNPIITAYGTTTGSTTLNWDATDWFQSGGYTGIQISVGSPTGSTICSSSSASGSCGSGTITNNQNFYLMGVRYNGTLVQGPSIGVSVVDAQPIVDIDTPDTTTSYLGGVAFGGWAIDHVYPISYVQVSIDGGSIGNAGYGGSRPDVCNAYTTAQSCPNVGYSIWFNTATLSGGNHTITVTAVDSNGDSASSSRTFNVQQAVTNYSIDTPNTSDTYLGQQNFWGWAVDNAYAISSVAISIDGVSYGNASYGSYRPDVCNALGNQPGCPYVGWGISIDTAKLSGGTHTFAITVTTADGRQISGSRTFNVQQAYTNIGIDTPQTNQTYYGAQSFVGWAIDDAFTISSVAISIDGASYGNASYGGSRPDVCNVYPGRPGCPNVGWSIAIDMSALTPGNHTLVATATAADGRQASQSRAFVSTRPATTISIDVPVSGQTYSGSVAFGGWAYDNVAAISSVTLTIDGVGFGNATYGGTRSDVCSAGQYPGCPNVGWNYGINTAQLPNRQHTLVVTATTVDSRVATKTVTFTASNPNPTTLHIDTPQSGGSYSGQQTFAGWAIDSASPIQSVAVAIDGTSYGNASYGTSRPDVCQGSPNVPGCPNVGWSALVDLTSLAIGQQHTLTITAATNDLIPRTTTQSVNFYVPDLRKIPSIPSREYIFQNGRVIAIENQQH